MSLPPPAAPLVKEVFRRARKLNDLTAPLAISPEERAAFDRFGIEVRAEADGPTIRRFFFIGTAPGWQRFTVAAQPPPPPPEVA